MKIPQPGSPERNGRICTVFQSERASWRFCYYLPGCRMPMHRHDTAQFSVLLGGTMRETIGRHDIESSHFVMQLRPAHSSHSVHFGDQGALLFSINLNDDDSWVGEMRQQSAYYVRNEWLGLIGELATSTLLCESRINDYTDDLLSAIVEAPFANDSVTDVPRWLQRARQALIDTELDTVSIAHEVGVHRVHLARSFRRHFSSSMTEFRRRARLASAAADMISQSNSLADTAAKVGFSDQSHMTREMRRECGITPAVLARMLSIASSSAA